MQSGRGFDSAAAFCKNYDANSFFCASFSCFCIPAQSQARYLAGLRSDSGALLAPCLTLFDLPLQQDFTGQLPPQNVHPINEDFYCKAGAYLL
jgi:hypothetical protein